MKKNQLINESEIEKITDDSKTNVISRRKSFWITMIALQFAVLLYSLTGVTAKFASNYSFLSYQFVLLFALEIFILMVYAVAWQQIIKKIPLAVAYTNKAITFLWALVWSALIFSETISVNNIIGVIIVIIGTVIVNIKR